MDQHSLMQPVNLFGQSKSIFESLWGCIHDGMCDTASLFMGMTGFDG